MKKRSNKKFKALTDGMPWEFKKVIALCERNYLITDNPLKLFSKMNGI